MHAASEFIAGLWSKRARDFGRAYWMHLSRKGPRPFGLDVWRADWICRTLDRIWREESRSVSFRED